MEENELNIKVQKYDKAAEKAALQKGSCMSDTKWAKMLKAIEESEIKYRSNEVCAKVFVYDNLWHICLADYLGNGKYTADSIAGPIRTKDIEYFIIPFKSINELYRMKELIDRIGKFEYDIDEKGLTIKVFGYR